MKNKSLPPIHILFENPSWLPPLVEALKAEGFEVNPVYVDEGLVTPSEPPAEGIWLNRISPSSHTRGHARAVGLARDVLAWLEAYGRRVVNGSNAFELEMSKTRQAIALTRHGILTPRTILAVGRAQILEAAERVGAPFITKHNQGGKGLGIHLFHTVETLAEHLDSGAFDPGPEEKIIVQQYIVPRTPQITRVEVIGGRLVLAMNSSTEEGFELCPSDACQVPASAPEVCPADGGAGGSKFSAAAADADDPLVQSYLRLCAAENIEIAGIEFVEDANGDRYTYDINGTTNYSGVLAQSTGIDGMREFAKYLHDVVAVEVALRERPRPNSQIQ